MAEPDEEGQPRMTESEWLACKDPRTMLKAFIARRKARKQNIPYPANRERLRLFACACSRRTWHLLGEDQRTAVEMIEDHALGKQPSRLLKARQVGWDAATLTSRAVSATNGRVAYCQACARNWAASAVWEAARDSPASAATAHLSMATAIGWCEHAEEEALHEGEEGNNPVTQPVASPRELEAQAILLRDVIGPPFRRRGGIIEPGWLVLNDGAVVKLAREIDESRNFAPLPILADALEESGCADQDILEHCRGEGLLHTCGCWVIDLILSKDR
jgi:hypothetical protein